MKTNIKGVGVALITPFKDSGEIDFEALERLLNRVISGGADYLVVLGTTAETPTLSAEERIAVTKFVIEKNNGKLPIVLGIGGNCTVDVVRSIQTTDLDGVDAILSVTPYYNKPSQDGIYQHYKTIAEASPRPIVMYNVPGRTGANSSAASIATGSETISSVRILLLSKRPQVTLHKPPIFCVIVLKGSMLSREMTT